MKVLPFKIPKPLNQNLIVQVDESHMFYNQLHQHEELQLSLIVKGQGKLIVGDSVHPFTEGDFLAIGSHCPHLLQNELLGGKKVKMISLFFTRESFGQGFFDLPDIEEVRAFFEFVKEGFILMSNREVVREIMLGLPGDDKLTRFVQLLRLLKMLCHSERKVLTGFVYPKIIGNTEGKRMQAVFDHVIHNFQNTITLEVVSELAYMTPNAFCRFFKNRTNKTFFQFLIELRLEHACQLLEETELSIAEISDRSGFNSISNFNRKFKAIKGISPTKFKMK